MSESDLLAALGGESVQFEVRPGVSVTLRPLSLADAGEYGAYEPANPADVTAKTAKLISLAASLNGTPITFDVARKLPATIAEKIAEKIAEITGWGEAAGNS